MFVVKIGGEGHSEDGDVRLWQATSNIGKITINKPNNHPIMARLHCGNYGLPRTTKDYPWLSWTIMDCHGLSSVIME